MKGCGPGLGEWRWDRRDAALGLRRGSSICDVLQVRWRSWVVKAGGRLDSPVDSFRQSEMEVLTEHPGEVQ